MKQHITKKQWGELNKDKADYLQGWMQNNGYNEDFEFKLNIGQMIEFLGDDWYSEIVRIVINEKDWTYSSDTATDFGKCDMLCDNLWKACKIRLNEIDK